MFSQGCKKRTLARNGLIGYGNKKKMQYKTCVKYNNIYDALRDSVPFVQFKKREKHPWRIAEALACNFSNHLCNVENFHS